MSTSTHQIVVKGKDSTQAAFQSIQARAIAAGNRISKVMGGAIAAAGAYLSFRSIKGAVDELGKLSDMAMKAGTSVDALTRTSLAFQVAGLDMPVESLAKAFQYLKKNTGEGGMENFYKTAAEIANIDDAAERGAALVKNFGKAGLELQPLIDGGAEAIEKMRTLADLMPGISQAAADAGDEAADSLKILGMGASSLFLEVVGNIIGMWSEDFPGGVRAGSLKAIKWLDVFGKKAKATAVLSVSNLIARGAWVYDYVKYGKETADKVLEGTTKAADKEFQAAMAAADAEMKAYEAKLKTLTKEDLDNLFGNGSKGRNGTEATATEAAERAVRVANKLILGGTNEANKLTAIGPQMAETKKQTELLKSIEKNTQKTAENTEEGEEAPTTDL